MGAVSDYLKMKNIIFLYARYHKHLSRNKMSCQAVFNIKISLDSIADELQDLRKLEKVLISKGTIFKKIAIMHGKREFAKINLVFVISPLK